MIEEKLNLKQTPVVTGPWPLQRGDSSENDSASRPVAAIDFRSIIQEQQKHQIDEVNASDPECVMSPSMVSKK